MTAVNIKRRTQPRRRIQPRRRTQICRRAQPRRRAQLRSRRKQAICRKTPCKRLLPKRRQQPLQREKQGKKAAIKRVAPEWEDQRNPTDVFIIKVLRRLHRDKVPISTKAKGKIISFIRKFYNKVYNKAKCSSKCKETCIIGSKELENALKRVLREKQAIELAKTIRNTSRRH